MQDVFPEEKNFEGIFVKGHTYVTNQVYHPPHKFDFYFQIVCFLTQKNNGTKRNL